MTHHVLVLAGQRVKLHNAVNLVAEELDPNRKFVVVGQVDVHRVPFYAELIADEVHVVALILQLDQAAAKLVALHLHTGAQADDHAAVVDGVAQRVDAGNRCYNDHVPPLRKRRRGRMAQAVDLIVDGAVLFNVGIGTGDVGFGLVVIVVGNKILHRIVREERAELGAELGRQRLIMGQHQRGAVAPGDHVGHGKGLAAAGHTQQGLAAVAPLNALYQLLNGLGLVTRGGIVGDEMELFIGHVSVLLSVLR